MLKGSPKNSLVLVYLLLNIVFCETAQTDKCLSHQNKLFIPVCPTFILVQLYYYNDYIYIL